MSQQSSLGQGQREEGQAMLTKRVLEGWKKFSNPPKWFKTHCPSFLALFLNCIHTLGCLRSNKSSINVARIVSNDTMSQIHHLTAESK